MKKILLVLITTFTYCCLNAQEHIRKNKLEINVGFGHIARQDLIFSPFVHKNLTFINLGVEYSREGKFYQKIKLNYAGFNPMIDKSYQFTEYGETEDALPHNFNLIDLDYLIGKKIHEKEKHILTAGVLFSTNIQAMNYVYGRFGNFGYFANLGLGLFIRENIKINDKSNINATLQLPVISWLARSPYLVNDDVFIENISSHSGIKSFIGFLGDGEMVSLDQLQTVDLELKYNYQINKKLGLGAGYNFEFIHSDNPRNLLSFRNALNISANINF